MGSKGLLSPKGWAAALLMAMLSIAAIMGACGGSSSNDSASATDTEQPADTSGDSSPAPATQSAPSSGSATGTLTVDGKDLEFNVVFCGFSPDETGNDNVPFSFRGMGDDGGRSFSVDASTVDLGSSKTDTVAMWYDDDPVNHVYESETGTFAIDGKSVNYDADFAGTDGASVGAGSMAATCP